MGSAKHKIPAEKRWELTLNKDVNRDEVRRAVMREMTLRKDVMRDVTVSKQGKRERERER